MAPHPAGNANAMAQPDPRLQTPVALEDAQLARAKEDVDRDIAALAHTMQRYAAMYLGHRMGELPEAPDPSLVGCDEHSAAVTRGLVEQALNAELLHGGMSH